MNPKKKTNSGQSRPQRVRECLTVKQFINMARGADPMDWSHPLPDPWEDRFLMICDAVAARRLNAAPGLGGKERWSRICLLDVRRFLADHGAGEEWAWLWETCQDWSQRCGRELTADAEGGPVGRRPANQSQAKQAWIAFDKRSGTFTFKHGELTRVANEIGGAIGYKGNTVEKLIRDEYLGLKETQKQTST